MLNVKELVTLSHDVGRSNSSTRLINVAMALPGIVWIHASCLGEKRVGVGGGATHSVSGTSTFVPCGSSVMLLIHP